MEFQGVLLVDAIIRHGVSFPPTHYSIVFAPGGSGTPADTGTNAAALTSRAYTVADARYHRAPVMVFCRAMPKPAAAPLKPARNAPGPAPAGATQIGRAHV